MRAPSLRALGLAAVLAWTAPGLAGAIRVMPDRVSLLGPDSVQQLAVDRSEAGRGPSDATRSAAYASAETRVAEVDSTGLIVARGDGETVVTVRFDREEVRVPVRVRGFARPPAVSFANQVVPIFTRLGCNSGGCHGKASGQNGFRLSLLGFEPSLDYETLVKEDRGRRVFPALAARSLLLEKATGQLPHGGGPRTAVGSHEYRVLLRWIEGGMPSIVPGEPTVERVAIYPESRRLVADYGQQVVVTATYSDGRTEDVTRWAQYQSNDPEVADVADGGLVRARGRSGLAAIMARYQGKVAVFRATVPREGRAEGDFAFVSDHPIDRIVSRQWRELGLQPSADATDAEFIRRASLDLIGTLPSAPETRAFVAERTPDKRAKLIDRLLDRPEYAEFFAIKWADVLRNKRDPKSDNAAETFRFHDWIRESLERNVPYDRFVRGILTASGTPESSPPVTWYRKKTQADESVDDAAQVFLGMRLQCARCHHHPYEVWGQDDYYGFAAFFARVKHKVRTDVHRDGRKEDVIVSDRSGTVTHPRTGRSMSPRGLGGAIVSVAASADPRERLVDWMASPANPYFARALANRYWAHFFGRGLVEPVDDMRLTNPPTNPELLDALADALVKSGYDMKALIRLIATSRVYGLSSVPNETNAADRQSFARHYPRRLGAEVLLDAISQLTATPTPFAGLPAGTRAIEVPDDGVASGFLDAFGRPKRDTACECERASEASLGQSLMLLNSPEVQAKLANLAGRAARLVKDPRPEAEKVSELFWDAFARAPDSGEAAAALDHLAGHDDPGERRMAYEDILWALVNAREFQFND